MSYLTKEEEINLIKNEIILLETECIRPMREWLLNINQSENFKKLSDLNYKIELLRQKLQ